MQVLDIIRDAQGGNAVANLARTFKIAPKQAEAVIAAVLPQLSQSLERNTLSRGGLADLVNALGQGHHEGYLDNPRALADPSTVSDGNAILGHILGDRDQSRAVAAEAARFSGLSEGLVKMLLPVLATWLMGALSKQVKGGLGEVLGRMGGGGGAGGGFPFPQPDAQSGGGGGGFGMPRLPEMPSGGGISMPDAGPDAGGSGGWPQGQDGGWRPSQRTGQRTGRQNDGGMTLPGGGGIGLPMPDMGGNAGGGLQMPGGMGGGSGGGMSGGSPLPLPGDRMPNFPGRGDNPYGDLSDILRKGGQIQLPGGGSSGGGALWSIVRNILGGALGFRSGGILSWLFRMVFMRFGWGLLKTVLGRGLFGR